MRKRIRNSFINHLEFNPTTQGRQGQKYFPKGVYEPNNPLHVSENYQARNEPKNYYAYLTRQRNQPTSQVQNQVKRQDRKLSAEEQHYLH